MRPSRLILTCDDAGASTWPDFLGFDAAIAALKAGALLDALSARICAVENAGVSSVGITGRPDQDNRVKLDAGVMTGWNGLLAGIGALEGYQSAFTVARRLWEMQANAGFKPVFLAGPGAVRFAREQRAEPARAILHGSGAMPSGQVHDTVGCIVYDGTDWAVGTSTSGTEGKYTDRIGDTPVPGAGFLAGRKCASFGTWTGDTALRLGMPTRVDTLVKLGRPIYEAVHAALAEFNTLQQGNIGGVILHTAAADGCAVAGIGFDGPIEADFTFWREGMAKPERHPVPQWHPTKPIPVF